MLAADMLAPSPVNWAWSPEIRPGKLQCQLKILVLLVLDPADTFYQLFRFSLCLLFEGGPVSHGDVESGAAVSLTLRASTCSKLIRQAR